MTEPLDPIKEELKDPFIAKMFESGAHFAYSKSRRHPSMAKLIFGAKNKVEIFDLTKTKDYLEKAKEFARKIGLSGKPLLFAGSKSEAKEAIKSSASSVGAPFVAGRWIGGTLTNFSSIRGRVEKLIDLTTKREKGELAKYTKKERLLIDREIENLEEMFAGLLPMKNIPGAIFIVDTAKEKTAVSEARSVNLPIISLMGSDCDLKDADYPIPANDSSLSSIKFFVAEILSAYKEGQNARPTATVSPVLPKEEVKNF